jgi:diacylglycerol kinase (ATP)
VRVTLLHNPSAGEEDHELEDLESLVAAAGHEVVCRSLMRDDWKAVLEEPGDLVAVAGGDGTVGEVSKEVATKDVPITLFPLGSANNIARTLEIPDASIEELVRGWESGRRVRFDLGQATAAWGEALFVESIGGGIFGRVLERAEDVDADEKDGDKKVRFGLELMRSVIAAEPAVPWRVEVGGVDHSGDYLAVEVTNIREIGPNFPLAADVHVGDGQLEVVLVGPEDREALVSYFTDRLEHAEFAPPTLTSRRGDRVVLEPPADCALHVDDELWPDEEPREREEGSIVLTPGPSVTILVPELA